MIRSRLRMRGGGSGGSITPTNYQIIANYGLMTNTSYAGTTSGRSDVQNHVRQFHKLGKAGTESIKIGMAGFRTSTTGSPSQALGNDYTSELAFEQISPASSTRLLYSGGNSTTIVNGSALTLTDALTVSLAAGETFSVRKNLEIAVAANVFPSISSYLIPTDQRFTSPLTTSQLLNTGSLSTPSGGLAASPAPCSIILGIPDTPLVSLMIIGDSIANGSTDNARGYIIRGIESVNGFDMPWCRQTVNSASYWSYAQAGSAVLQDYWQYATHILFELGVNDVLNGRTLVQIQTDALGLWAIAKAKSSPYGKTLKVYQTLITPSCTTTDSYATLANQTPRTGFGVGGIRDQLNTWIIAKVADGTIDGYVDPNSVIADSVEPNKWVVNGTGGYATSDGTHPSGTFHSTVLPPVINAWASARGIASDGSGT